MKRPKHILIVEDDRWQGEIYRDILEQRDFQVTLCPGGQAAIEALDKRLPQAIVLDMMLPDANGIAFLHELQSYEDSMAIPVIVCTTVQLTASFRQALTHYGVHAVLDKAEITPHQLAGLLAEMTTHE
ncbi:MAG TPA: response regulator [Candidatus Saccharimonadales bacterium]